MWKQEERVIILKATRVNHNESTHNIHNTTDQLHDYPKTATRSNISYPLCQLLLIRYLRDRVLQIVCASQSGESSRHLWRLSLSGSLFAMFVKSLKTSLNVSSERQQSCTWLVEKYNHVELKADLTSWERTNRGLRESLQFLASLRSASTVAS